MQLVETIEVGAGGAASIEFTSIPQDADDLLLVVSARSDDAGQPVDVLEITVNSSTANRSTRYLQFFGTSPASGTTTNLRLGFISTNANTTNTFNTAQAYIANYSGSSAKSVSAESLAEDNSSSTGGGMSACLWNDTSAITSLQIFVTGNNLVQYSTASLYKIVKAA